MRAAVIGVSLVCLTLSALAQPPGRSDGQGREHRGPGRLHDQLQALDLTETQRAEVDLILVAHREQMDVLRETGASCEDFEVLRTDLRTSLAEVLTEDQSLALEPNGQNQRQRRGGPRGPRNCTPEESS